jgi:hypothetical protein
MNEYYTNMNQEKVKLIVHNMELLVRSLKEELQESPNINYNNETFSYIEDDVDEYYEEN